MALEFDRMRMTPSLPYRWDKIMDFGLFVRMGTRMQYMKMCCMLWLPMLRTSPQLVERNAILVQNTYHHNWSVFVLTLLWLPYELKLPLPK